MLQGLILKGQRDRHRASRGGVLRDVDGGDDAAGAQPPHAVLQLVERRVLGVGDAVHRHGPLPPHLQLPAALERPPCIQQIELIDLPYSNLAYKVSTSDAALSATCCGA